MQSNKNTAIIACAGAGKTTCIVKTALKLNDRRILITTYTNENVAQIYDCFIEHNGFVPKNIEIMPWSTFLLQEGVRPYQNHMSNHRRVKSIYFQQGGSIYHKKDNYFTKGNDIYSNKLSEFVFECNKTSGDLVLKRLEKIYSQIFIDELQDFAGYDLNLLDSLFNSNIEITIVGDPRQATFSTNFASKNRKFRRHKIFDWLKERERNGAIEVEENNVSYRCNPSICDFSDRFYPDYSKTISQNLSPTGHDGVFLISPNDIEHYIKKYQPKVLRHNKRAKTAGLPAMNIGASKGRTYNRVLIFPTAPMLEYIKSADILKAGDITKFYIAVTRARHSVAFVIDKKRFSSNLASWWRRD